MPNYAFVSVSNPKVVTERFYHMDSAPSIGSTITDKDGSQWRRLAVNPQASFDTQCDPYSASDFVKATNKRDNVGALWDRSAEMSAKRTEKDGKDEVKQQFYDGYARRRRGKRHPQEIREAGTRHLKSKGISIEWGDD